ncbi:MAG: hypothetical protein IJ518_06600 [Clostridia bacterium]|nr:hypothetical protein [Clostridia bacterium]
MKKSDYIRNEALHTTRHAYPEKGFVAYNCYSIHGGHGNIPQQMIEDSLTAHGLGEDYYTLLDGYGTPKFPRYAIGEWGFSFLNLNGTYAGSGHQMHGSGWVVHSPKTDEEAVEIMRTWLYKQYTDEKHQLEEGEHGVAAINGHTLFQHYAAEWGFDQIGSEIGENTGMHQAHMAFTRGAGRQYGKLTIMDFSNWNAGTIGTWETKPSWPQGSSTGGHSLSLLKRAYVMSYMGGASDFLFEVACLLSFIGEEAVDENGILLLSPYGKQVKELLAFTADHRDIGIAYTPIGLVIDHYRGWATCAVLEDGAGYRHDRALGCFPNTPGDDMVNALFYLLYPGASPFNWHDYFHQAPEQMAQVNNAYGDVFDYITHKASQAVLDSYPVLVLCGDIDLTAEAAQRYIAYVQKGGTLLCNTAYLRFFADYQAAYDAGAQTIPDGEGTVIVYGPDYSVEALDGLLKEQIKKHVPFTLSDEVQYLVNVKDGSLILTLINNEGVTKVCSEPPVIDESKAKTITVTYTGDEPVAQVKELYYGEPVDVDGNAVTVTVGPGDVQVLEFVFD